MAICSCCYRCCMFPPLNAYDNCPGKLTVVALKHFIYSNDLELPEETTPERYHKHLIVFILNYIAMIPSANLVGFAGQELARKLPKVAGVFLETSLGSITEIILFIALTSQKSPAGVIRSAILGSILANLLLALGACFVSGGATREEQVFHEAVSEVGSGLMLVAGCETPTLRCLHRSLNLLTFLTSRPDRTCCLRDRVHQYIRGQCEWHAVSPGHYSHKSRYCNMPARCVYRVSR